MHDDIDMTDLLAWEDGLPLPKWDLIEAWVDSRDDVDCGESACRREPVAEFVILLCET